MNPQSDHPGMGSSPLNVRPTSWSHRTLVLALLALLAVPATAGAQPRSRRKAAPASGKQEPASKGKPKVFDFTGLGLEGRLRTPQLLYFLDRASEELEQASLERRSFIPDMVRSLDEAGL